MNMKDSELLQQYVESGSDAAFAELVERYVEFVYSTARRQITDAHLAEEVVQSVFCLLARKAGSLTDRTTLAGWLYRTTCFTAAKTLRTEMRRHSHEQEAATMNQDDKDIDKLWQTLAPTLDEGMGKLGENDRLALILRFFQRKAMWEVGEALGVSEGAAKMRVARAVEQLRKFFAKRGGTCTVAALTVALAEKTVSSAPVDLTRNILAAVSGVTPASISSIFLTSMLGKALITGAVAAGVLLGAGIYFHMASQSARITNSAGGSNELKVAGGKFIPNPSESSSNAAKYFQTASNDPKLNEAVEHLRRVLHTRPTNHSIYDYEQITNAILKFEENRRLAFGVLRENFVDPQEFVRAGAVAGMGYVGKYVPEAAPFLWDSLYRGSSHDCWHVFRALQNIGLGPWDLPALTGLLADGVACNNNILTKLVPEAITKVIGENPQAAKPYLPNLEELLKNTDPDTRFRAALALINTKGTNNSEVHSALHELFQRPNDRHNEYYKYLAAGILADAGPVAKPLVPDLLEFAKSASEKGVQEVANRAVAKIEPGLSAQIPEVAQILKQQENDQMWSNKWKSGSFNMDALKSALKEPMQALIAADHLAAMRTAAREEVPDIIQAMWGKNEDERDAILADIHKIDPQVNITKIKVDEMPYAVAFGSARQVLDAQPSTELRKEQIAKWEQFYLFSVWVLPEELAAYTNKLAMQTPDAYHAYVNALNDAAQQGN